jgi:hypothetical protein
MPKLPHEALVQLIRAAPDMVVDLLRPLLGGLPTAPIQVVPQVTAAELVNLDLAERRADAVLLLGDPQRPDEAFVVEAQSDPDPRKRRVWPFYVTGFAVRFDCPVTLVVFALDEEVAAWCDQPIDLGRGRGFLFPVVIRPRNIPVITDPARAAAAPELAVLSVLAHGREPGAEYIAQAALAACERLDTQAGLHYADFEQANRGRNRPVLGRNQTDRNLRQRRCLHATTGPRMPNSRHEREPPFRPHHSWWAHPAVPRVAQRAGRPQPGAALLVALLPEPGSPDPWSQDR